ncbi:hypothetical protein MPDQ_002981 [Monascus purpureus]|uniref:Uncharacterized protein n=1 Tax=Monascus purpureus TaxID=5098 RepID=A0A507R5H2_MONPU|nr:hypothetical protein MPDQ_002981 [Monascus purpureus]BDD59457.1 hypothetical protein MAP00_004664 [Monascus purpureus]
MGNKISAINGVRSPNYFKPGNAINEIWLGNLEVVSRLPFGDSDMAQAGWPAGEWPKIPWHQFIIPLKRRSIEESTSITDAHKHELLNSTAHAEREFHIQNPGLSLGNPFTGLSTRASLAAVVFFLFAAFWAYVVSAAARDRSQRYLQSIAESREKPVSCIERNELKGRLNSCHRAGYQRHNCPYTQFGEESSKPLPKTFVLRARVDLGDLDSATFLFFYSGCRFRMAQLEKGNEEL